MIMRDVYVLGIGQTKFGVFEDYTGVDLGVRASVEAVKDAGINAKEIEVAYGGYCRGPSTQAQMAFTRLGTGSIPDGGRGLIGYNALPPPNGPPGACPRSEEALAAFREGIERVHRRGGRVIAYLEAFIISRDTELGRTAGPRWAMMDENGFVKAIVEMDTGRVLGFHIIGPYAPILIQEVIDTMASGSGINQIQASMHIHPAISELIPVVFSDLENPQAK